MWSSGVPLSGVEVGHVLVCYRSASAGGQGSLASSPPRGVTHTEAGASKEALGRAGGVPGVSGLCWAPGAAAAVSPVPETGSRSESVSGQLSFETRQVSWEAAPDAS